MVWDHLRSVARGRVYTAFAYEARAFQQRLTEVLRQQRFDLVHVDSLDLVRYLPLLEGLPVVLGHHNVESELLRRRAEAEPSFLRRLYLAHQARLMENEERRFCGDVALNVVVSEAERSALRVRVPAAPVIVVPNGVDTEAFRPVDGRDEGVVFVGGLSWSPNHDALVHFCDDVLPHLRSRMDPVGVRWVGQASPSQQRHFGDTFGVELTGYVEDTRPYVHDAACYVVPLRIGGGTRLKILEAWAMGKAVVSTSLGCEGLRAVDGLNILIRDEPAAFAAAVAEVLSDRPLRQRLGANARETAERFYGWSVVGNHMLGAYGDLLNGGGAVPTADELIGDSVGSQLTARDRASSTRC
jgi:polysaccharide biosynthesis protein PslH